MPKYPRVPEVIDDSVRRAMRRAGVGLQAVSPTPALMGPRASNPDRTGGDVAPVTKDYIKETVQAGAHLYAASSAASDAYAVNLYPVPTALTVGMLVSFQADVANTGAATLQVNSLPDPAAAIKKQHDQDLATGDIEAGQIVQVQWDGTVWQMQSPVASTAAGAGDMTKVVYDTDDDGVVDAAEVLDDGVNQVSAADAQSAVNHLTDANAHDAVEIVVDTAAMDGNLAGIDPDVQSMLEAIDDLELGSGSGTDMQNRPNLLINGGFDFFQRQAPETPTSRADDTYGPDRWYVLTQSGAVNVERYTLQLSSANGLLLTQAQASAQRVGIAQIVEHITARTAGGKTVMFQGKVQCSVAGNIKIAILGYQGSADLRTSDMVNDWTSSTYTAGNFFINTDAPNEIFIGTQAVNPALSPAQFSLSATFSGYLDNIIVFVWTESTLAQNETLRLSECDLFLGNSTRTWQPRPIAAEMALCQRYYEKSYPVDIAPGTAATNGFHKSHRSDERYYAAMPLIPFHVQKRTVPTMTLYAVNGSAGYVSEYISGTDQGANKAAAAASLGDHNALWYATGGDLRTTGNYNYCWHWTAEAEL